MSRPLDTILAAPAGRISPAAREAMASVKALAEQQATAPAEAADFTEPEQDKLSCSFSWNPEALKLDLSASQAVTVDTSKVGGKFTITLHF